MKHSRASKLAVLSLPLVAAVVLGVAGCSSTDAQVNRAAAGVEASSDSVQPDAMNSSSESPQSPKVGGPLDMTRLPFAVVNDLPMNLHMFVRDVKVGDWNTSSSIGTPGDVQPKGFNGETITPGKALTGIFEPKSGLNNANFRLELSGIVGDFPFAKSVPLPSISLQKLFFCERLPITAEIACGAPARSHWKGWSFPIEGATSLEQQFPKACGAVTAPFTYQIEGVEHRGQGRLSCTSKATAGLGTALVLEDIA